MKKLPIGLAAAALVLTATLSIGGAMGYFTTYSTASGGVTLNMGFTTTVPHETVDEGGKHVTIENTGEYDCFVRVTAFSTVGLSYNCGEGWSDTDGDGYYEYSAVLAPGEKTTELNITYTLPTKTDENGKEVAGDDVDVIVVQECTPVLYSEDGTAYADWDHVVTTTSETE